MADPLDLNTTSSDQSTPGNEKSPPRSRRALLKAGDLGFEPRLTDPESVVLPLHQSPIPPPNFTGASKGRQVQPQSMPRHSFVIVSSRFKTTRATIVYIAASATVTPAGSVFASGLPVATSPALRLPAVRRARCLAS